MVADWNASSKNKKWAIALFFNVAFTLTLYGQVSWNQTGANTTTGNITIEGHTTSTEYDDISVTRNKANAGIRVFNANWSGRSIVFFGQALEGKYGYLAHHGQSHVSDPGYTETFKASSTVLTGQDINGLGIASAADIRFNAGGVDDSKLRVIFKANGNVGIGTQPPAWKLDVNGPIATRGQAIMDVGTNEIGIGDISSSDGFKDKLHFYTRDQKRMTVDENGNLGVGIATPWQRLHVYGAKGNSGTGIVRIDGADANASLRIGIDTDYAWIQSHGSRPLYINDFGNNTILNASHGNVGIGTKNPDAKLSVKGVVHAEEVRVDLTVQGPDYVFEDGYPLTPLSDLENFIRQNKHLPEVPSAKEMETNGINVSEMNMLLLKKVEELTLHLIELKKENDATRCENAELRTAIEQIKSHLEKK
jgi:hypothetical protein